MKRKCNLLISLIIFLSISMKAQQSELNAGLTNDAGVFVVNSVIESTFLSEDAQMITISVVVNTAGNEDLRAQGKIELINTSQPDQAFEYNFTSNEAFSLEIPEGQYFVSAWIPGSEQYARTFFGNALICSNTNNFCGTEALPVASVYNSAERNLSLNLLEYNKKAFISFSSITLEIADNRTQTRTGKPIKDVDVTLMKIPPGSAFIPTVPPLGNEVKNMKYTRLQSEDYMFYVNVPGLEIKENKCFPVKFSTDLNLIIVVNDDGIYIRQQVAAE